MSQPEKRPDLPKIKLDEKWYLGSDEHNFIIYRKEPARLKAWKFWPRIEMALKWWTEQALRDGHPATLEAIIELQKAVYERIDRLAQESELAEIMERKQ